MRTISLESFDKETRSEGLWTLQDANEPERALLQELEPDKQVEQVLIPTKYIKEGGEYGSSISKHKWVRRGKR